MNDALDPLFDAAYDGSAITQESLDEFFRHPNHVDNTIEAKLGIISCTFEAEDDGWVWMNIHDDLAPDQRPMMDIDDYRTPGGLHAFQQDACDLAREYFGEMLQEDNPDLSSEERKALIQKHTNLLFHPKDRLTVSVGDIDWRDFPQEDWEKVQQAFRDAPDNQVSRTIGKAYFDGQTYSFYISQYDKESPWVMDLETDSCRYTVKDAMEAPWDQDVFVQQFEAVPKTDTPLQAIGFTREVPQSLDALRQLSYEDLQETLTKEVARERGYVYRKEPSQEDLESAKKVLEEIFKMTKEHGLSRDEAMHVFQEAVHSVAEAYYGKSVQKGDSR